MNYVLIYIFFRSAAHPHWRGSLFATAGHAKPNVEREGSGVLGTGVWLSKGSVACA